MLTHKECNPGMLEKNRQPGGLRLHEWKVQMGLSQSDLHSLPENIQFAASTKTTERCWIETNGPTPIDGECRGKGHSHYVILGQMWKKNFTINHPIFKKRGRRTRNYQVTSLLEFIKRENRLTVKFHQRWVTFLMDVTTSA